MKTKSLIIQKELSMIKHFNIQYTEDPIHIPSSPTLTKHVRDILLVNNRSIKHREEASAVCSRHQREGWFLPDLKLIKQ